MVDRTPAAETGRVGSRGGSPPGAVLSIVLATRAKYLLVVDLGTDQSLFRDPDTPAALHPGRMARRRARASSLRA